MKGTLAKQTDTRAKGGKGMENNASPREQKKEKNVCLNPRNALFQIVHQFKYEHQQLLGRKEGRISCNYV